MFLMYSKRIYPSKILLTGEYSVLLGSPALAIPWTGRYAEWIDSGTQVNRPLLDFFHYIQNHPTLKTCFLLDSFDAYIKQGAYLKSTIPYGYGLGSSGSFCAAIFHRFSNVEDQDTHLVHHLLKLMESHFHGESSGLDPMVCYYNSAVKICNGIILFPEIASDEVFIKHNLKLIDTKLSRNTQGLVSHFKESIEHKTYLSKINEEIIPTNNLIMDSLLNNNTPDFVYNWKKLSISSIDVFNQMIPGSFIDFWKNGIETDTYYCKLCGAGGGGLFLVMVLDELAFTSSLSIHALELFQ